MSARIIPMRRPLLADRATIHVHGDATAGFEVGHESASGGSCGNSSGPYPNGQVAIAAAYALNRDEYGGGCNIFICDAAVDHGRTDSAHLAPREDI